MLSPFMACPQKSQRCSGFIFILLRHRLLLWYFRHLCCVYCILYFIRHLQALTDIFWVYRLFSFQWQICRLNISSILFDFHTRLAVAITHMPALSRPHRAENLQYYVHICIVLYNIILMHIKHIKTATYGILRYTQYQYTIATNITLQYQSNQHYALYNCAIMLTSIHFWTIKYCIHINCMLYAYSIFNNIILNTYIKLHIVQFSGVEYGADKNKTLLYNLVHCCTR